MRKSSERKSRVKQTNKYIKIKNRREKINNSEDKPRRYKAKVKQSKL